MIEVSGFNDQSWFDRAGNHHTEQMKVTERLTRKDVNTLKYRFTVEDPTTFTAPFSGELEFRAMAPGEQVYEYACHEANYGLDGVMSGARAQEREAAKKRQQQ